LDEYSKKILKIQGVYKEKAEQMIATSAQYKEMDVYQMQNQYFYDGGKGKTSSDFEKFSNAELGGRLNQKGDDFWDGFGNCPAKFNNGKLNAAPGFCRNGTNDQLVAVGGVVTGMELSFLTTNLKPFATELSNLQSNVMKNTRRADDHVEIPTDANDQEKTAYRNTHEYQMQERGHDGGYTTVQEAVGQREVFSRVVFVDQAERWRARRVLEDIWSEAERISRQEKDSNRQPLFGSKYDYNSSSGMKRMREVLPSIFALLVSTLGTKESLLKDVFQEQRKRYERSSGEINKRSNAEKVFTNSVMGKLFGDSNFPVDPSEFTNGTAESVVREVPFVYKKSKYQRAAFEMWSRTQNLKSTALPDLIKKFKALNPTRNSKPDANIQFLRGLEERLEGWHDDSASITLSIPGYVLVKMMSVLSKNNLVGEDYPVLSKSRSDSEGSLHLNPKKVAVHKMTLKRQRTIPITKEGIGFPISENEDEKLPIQKIYETELPTWSLNEELYHAEDKKAHFTVVETYFDAVFIKQWMTTDAEKWSVFSPISKENEMNAKPISADDPAIDRDPVSHGAAFFELKVGFSSSSVSNRGPSSSSVFNRFFQDGKKGNTLSRLNLEKESLDQKELSAPLLMDVRRWEKHDSDQSDGNVSHFWKSDRISQKMRDKKSIEAAWKRKYDAKRAALNLERQRTRSSRSGFGIVPQEGGLQSDSATSVSKYCPTDSLGISQLMNPNSKLGFLARKRENECINILDQFPKTSCKDDLRDLGVKTSLEKEQEEAEKNAGMKGLAQPHLLLNGLQTTLDMVDPPELPIGLKSNDGSYEISDEYSSMKDHPCAEFLKHTTGIRENGPDAFKKPAVASGQSEKSYFNVQRESQRRDGQVEIVSATVEIKISALLMALKELLGSDFRKEAQDLLRLLSQTVMVGERNYEKFGLYPGYGNFRRREMMMRGQVLTHGKTGLRQRTSVQSDSEARGMAKNWIETNHLPDPENNGVASLKARALPHYTNNSSDFEFLIPGNIFEFDFQDYDSNRLKLSTDDNHRVQAQKKMIEELGNQMYKDSMAYAGQVRRVAEVATESHSEEDEVIKFGVATQTALLEDNYHRNSFVVKWNPKDIRINPNSGGLGIGFGRANSGLQSRRDRLRSRLSTGASTRQNSEVENLLRREFPESSSLTTRSMLSPIEARANMVHIKIPLKSELQFRAESFLDSEAWNSKTFMDGPMGSDKVTSYHTLTEVKWKSLHFPGDMTLAGGKQPFLYRGIKSGNDGNSNSVDSGYSFLPGEKVFFLPRRNRLRVSMLTDKRIVTVKNCFFKGENGAVATDTSDMKEKWKFDEDWYLYKEFCVIEPLGFEKERFAHLVGKVVPSFELSSYRTNNVVGISNGRWGVIVSAIQGPATVVERVPQKRGYGLGLGLGTQQPFGAASSHFGGGPGAQSAVSTPRLSAFTSRAATTAQPQSLATQSPVPTQSRATRSPPTVTSPRIPFDWSSLAPPSELNQSLATRRASPSPAVKRSPGNGSSGHSGSSFLEMESDRTGRSTRVPSAATPSQGLSQRGQPQPQEATTSRRVSAAPKVSPRVSPRGLGDPSAAAAAVQSPVQTRTLLDPDLSKSVKIVSLESYIGAIEHLQAEKAVNFSRYGENFDWERQLFQVLTPYFMTRIGDRDGLTMSSIKPLVDGQLLQNLYDSLVKEPVVSSSEDENTAKSTLESEDDVIKNFGESIAFSDYYHRLEQFQLTLNTGNTNLKSHFHSQLTQIQRKIIRRSLGRSKPGFPGKQGSNLSSFPLPIGGLSPETDVSNVSPSNYLGAPLHSEDLSLLTQSTTVCPGDYLSEIEMFFPVAAVENSGKYTTYPFARKETLEALAGLFGPAEFSRKGGSMNMMVRGLSQNLVYNNSNGKSEKNNVHVFSQNNGFLNSVDIDRLGGRGSNSNTPRFMSKTVGLNGKNHTMMGFSSQSAHSAINSLVPSSFVNQNFLWLPDPTPDHGSVYNFSSDMNLQVQSTLNSSGDSIFKSSFRGIKFLA